MVGLLFQQANPLDLNPESKMALVWGIWKILKYKLNAYKA